MKEEFHGNGGEDGVYTYQLLYGWGTLTANVWLPSLSELAGVDLNKYDTTRGVYYSAMQDIPNVTTQSSPYNVDKNGGEQWAWLVPFNPSGGAAEIWRLCENTTAWVRSPDKATAISVWAVTSQTMISWAQLATRSRAVHPAGEAIFRVSFFLYPPKVKRKNREKLRAKAVREEFHGIWNDGNGPFKQLYGWGTISANIWLPSLSELVGYDPNKYNDARGCYYSAMQGLNISTTPDTDKQGGNQWNYFAQYNASGGGEKLWNAVQKQTSWVRSCVCLNADRAWRITDDTRFDWGLVATASNTVHPVVETSYVSFAYPQRSGKSSITPLFLLLSPKRHTRLTFLGLRAYRK